MAPKKKNGLGKGLDALFLDNAIDESGVKVAFPEKTDDRAGH